MAFTFKTTKPTGRYRSFFEDDIEIKRNKHKVGSIDSKRPFKIRFMVIKDGVRFIDNNPNCKWKWIILLKEFESVDEAKKFLNDNFDIINKTYPLSELDD